MSQKVSGQKKELQHLVLLLLFCSKNCYVYSFKLFCYFFGKKKDDSLVEYKILGGWFEVGTEVVIFGTSRLKGKGKVC